MAKKLRSPNAPGVVPPTSLKGLIADLLKNTPERHNLCQRDLAEHTGITPASVYSFSSRDSLKTTREKCLLLAEADERWTGRPFEQRVKLWLNNVTKREKAPVVEATTDDLRSELHEIKLRAAKQRGEDSPDVALRQSEIGTMQGILEKRLGVDLAMLDKLSSDEIQHLLVSTYTTAKLQAYISDWKVSQVGADRAYLLCESPSNLEETAMWLGELAEQANPQTLFIAPKTYVSEREWKGVKDAYLKARTDLDPQLLPGLRIYLSATPPPVPQSFAAFTRLLKYPSGALLFSDDDLTAKLVGMYQSPPRSVSLEKSLLRARPLTNSCQMVADEVIFQCLTFNGIIPTKGRGSSLAVPTSFPVSSEQWDQLTCEGEDL